MRKNLSVHLSAFDTIDLVDKHSPWSLPECKKCLSKIGYFVRMIE